MPSTFFGLTIASSGLSTFQTAVNTTANNISNVDTKGYTKQEAVKQALASLRVNAKYGTAGSGVEVTSIIQSRDQYYDTKYWSNQCKLGEYETKYYYLSQIETYYQDNDKVSGFSTIFGDMYDAMDTLKTDASSTTTRNAFISAASKLTEFFNSTSTQLTQLQEEINDVISTKVSSINSSSQKIASLTKQINIIEQQGGTANELRDQRALLVDDLSKLVPVTVEENKVQNSNYPDMETGATSYVVKVNGQTLVSTYDYKTLECRARGTDEKINATDVDGLYDIYWSDTGNQFSVSSNSMTGELKALYELRDGNNGANFSGTLKSAANYTKDDGSTATRITISDPSITNIAQLNLPTAGTITLGNKVYSYQDYRMIQADDGTVTYQFDLNDTMTDSEIGTLTDEPVRVGESVAFMGIPYYQSQMNEFVRSYAKVYNDLILDPDNPGVDLNGDETGPFFVAENQVKGGAYDYDNTQSTTAGTTTTYGSDYYYLYLTAGNLIVDPDVTSDASKMATSTKEASTSVDSYDLIEKLLKTESDVTVFRGGVASDFLQCLISDISVDTQKVEIFKDNYTNLSTAITNQRMSVSSVDKDEEALDLVKFQNAYNLSSKMVQVMSEMYDRLITQTGV